MITAIKGIAARRRTRSSRASVGRDHHDAAIAIRAATGIEWWALTRFHGSDPARNAALSPAGRGVVDEGEGAVLLHLARG